MTMKTAKDWFKAHPRCVVTFHRRWDQLSPASRERLSLPRDVKIMGHRAVFSHSSEVMLRGCMADVDSDDRLMLVNQHGEHFVTYGPVA